MARQRVGKRSDGARGGAGGKGDGGNGGSGVGLFVLLSVCATLLPVFLLFNVESELLSVFFGSSGGGAGEAVSNEVTEGTSIQSGLFTPTRARRAEDREVGG